MTTLRITPAVREREAARVDQEHHPGEAEVAGQEDGSDHECVDHGRDHPRHQAGPVSLVGARLPGQRRDAAPARGLAGHVDCHRTHVVRSTARRWRSSRSIALADCSGRPRCRASGRRGPSPRPSTRWTRGSARAGPRRRSPARRGRPGPPWRARRPRPLRGRRAPARRRSGRPGRAPGSTSSRAATASTSTSTSTSARVSSSSRVSTSRTTRWQVHPLQDDVGQVEPVQDSGRCRAGWRPRRRRRGVRRPRSTTSTRRSAVRTTRRRQRTEDRDRSWGARTDSWGRRDMGSTLSPADRQAQCRCAGPAAPHPLRTIRPLAECEPGWHVLGARMPRRLPPRLPPARACCSAWRAWGRRRRRSCCR